MLRILLMVLAFFITSGTLQAQPVDSRDLKIMLLEQRIERLERAAVLTQSVIPGDQRSRKLLSNDWYDNWSELYTLLKPLLKGNDKALIDQKDAEIEAYNKKKQAEDKAWLEQQEKYRKLK